ncbi:MAG TPA: extracellular solute-binding protein [Burkholderiales bacterium]|nr:extracellular solute-binding protein [Burkholderiales bacterium]
MSLSLSRRRFLGTGAALAAGAIAPGLARAQAAKLVGNTYPGIYEELFRNVFAPALRKQGIDPTWSPILVVDVVAKIMAARDSPPFDVVLFDEGPLINVLKDDIFAKFPDSRSPNFKDLPEQFRGFDNTGPVITVQAIGLAYNPKKLARPKSWNDLWKKEYKGRVGLTGMASSLGTAYMCEIAKVNGGSERNFEPAFAKIKELLPGVASVAPSPGALVALFQQGEIDIAPNYFNNTMLLKSKGVDIDFAVPDTGPVMVRTTLNIVKNTKQFDAAVKYIDIALSPEVQQAMLDKPYFSLSTSSKVKFPPEVAMLGTSVPDMLKRGVLLNWAEINKIRPQLIDRFNREIKV